MLKDSTKLQNMYVVLKTKSRDISHLILGWSFELRRTVHSAVDVHALVPGPGSFLHAPIKAILGTLMYGHAFSAILTPQFQVSITCRRH